MGHTHYLALTPTEKSEKQFQLVLKDCKKIMEHNKHIEIRGSDGEGEPIFNDTEICINGNQAMGEWCEDFEFNPIGQFSPYCKTNMEAYDFIVMCILISIMVHMTGINFESDGDIEDFETAIEYYDKHVGNFNKTARKRFAKCLRKGKRMSMETQKLYVRIENQLNMI